MGQYRSWAERRAIIRAVIAERADRKVADFDLTLSEESFFRLRSERLISKLAKSSATFKSYYKIRKIDQFFPVIASAAIFSTCFVTAIFILLLFRSKESYTPSLISACIAATVASVGWAITSGITHNNAVRQNTTNLIFARFSQASYNESLHRFHEAFGYDENRKVTMIDVSRLLSSNDEELRKQGASIFYILNYFEYIAVGVIKGDISEQIVSENLKGTIEYYYDKCEPLIISYSKVSPKTAENLIKLRAHYREA